MKVSSVSFGFETSDRTESSLLPSGVSLAFLLYPPHKEHLSLMCFTADTHPPSRSSSLLVNYLLAFHPLLMRPLNCPDKPWAALSLCVCLCIYMCVSACPIFFFFFFQVIEMYSVFVCMCAHNYRDHL